MARDLAKERFLEMVWLNFIDWATKEEPVVNAFLSETGEHLIRPPKNAIEAMIDRATGAEEHNTEVMKKFVVWVTENYWGEENAPQIYFEKFKEKAHA